MSYTKSYRTSITIRGSETISYPASENGGSKTVNWQHTEPINVEIDVNTNPFDQSVSKCDQNLNILKGAVVAMNSAQVFSIKKASRNIAEHVTSGFFGMVRSELSQQVADLMNKVNSKLSLMIEQKKAATNILDVMRRDYNRLSGHYHDLFHNLDEELRRRIYTLDSPSFNLSIEVMDKLMFQNTLSEAATYSVESSDIGSTQTRISASAMRSKVNNMLSISRDYLADDRKLSHSLQYIIDDKSIGAKLNEYVPVIIVEKSQLNSPENQTDFLIPDETPANMLQGIQKSIKTKATKLKWHKSDSSQLKNIEAEYVKMINDDFSAKTGSKSLRQRDLMLKLWSNTLPEILA